MLSPLSTSPCSYTKSPTTTKQDFIKKEFAGEKTADVIGDVVVDSMRSDNDESAPSHESIRKLENDTKPVETTDFVNHDTVKESVIDKSLDLHIPTSTSFTQDPIKETTVSAKDPQPPQPRVLTPTPGSGEQKVTKDEPAGVNTSETQNLRKINNATSKSIEHSDND